MSPGADGDRSPSGQRDAASMPCQRPHHSRDCYESLATIAEPDASAARRTTIQRPAPARGRAVLFTEQDIINAAKRGIEVR